MTKTITLLTLTFFVTQFACKKKDDDSDEGSSENLVLMESLDLNCGDAACFGDSGSSLKLLNDDSALQTMRMFAQISLGFPNEATYVETIGEDASDSLKALVPETGFVGNIEDVRAEVVAGAKTAYATLSKCSDAPTSGDFTVGDNSATWNEPSMKAPSSFADEKAGETYDKAVSFTSADGKTETHFEFFCDYKGMASVFTVNDDNGDLAARYALFYDRNEDDKLYVDFYLLDDSGEISSGGLELGVQLRSLEAGNMETWVSRTGVDPEKGIQGYRYAVNANLDDEDISFFILNEDEGYTAAEWKALTYETSTTVTGGKAISSGSSVDELKNGCADSWDAANEELTSKTLCTGLALSEAPAPALDETGDASLSWVRANLRDLIEAL